MSRTDAAAPDAPSAPPRRKLRRLLRLAAWNALFITIGLALVALGGEAYFRVTKPFMVQFYPQEFVPGVGILFTPHRDAQVTNRLDYWNVARVNSWGFLDREPSGAVSTGCPIAIIGDSFVEAGEVPIADKLQVRIEEMAAAQLPHLNLTASAFGKGNTGQIEQLPHYDYYARRLRPRLLVLVFVNNDVWNNHPVLRAVYSGRDPQHLPTVSVMRRPDGTLALRPPDPDYWRFNLPAPPRPPLSWADRALNAAGKISWFARWLKAKKAAVFPAGTSDAAAGAQAEQLSKRPQYAPILGALPLLPRKDLAEQLAGGNLSPIYAEALEYTAFALRQFRERADRDGAALVILATHTVKETGTPLFDWLGETAAAQGIPVVDQADYILRQGGRPAEAHWRHNKHWTPQGHQWAAEALLEWLQENQEICGPEPAAAAPPFK